MSIRLISKAWESSAKGNHLLTLIALADGADDDQGRTWPSVATLMAKTKLSRATLFRILADLEAAGLIQREHREGHSNVFYVLQESQTETPEDPSQNETRLTDETGRGLTGETGGVSPVRPRTVRESPQEPSGVAPDGASDRLPAPRRRRDLLFEALMLVAGVDLADIPASARGAYNRARADLAAVGATPEEVLRRGAIFRATWPDVRLTPTALARRWAEVGAYVPNGSAHRLRMTAEHDDLRARMRALDEREGLAG